MTESSGWSRKAQTDVSATVYAPVNVAQHLWYDRDLRGGPAVQPGQHLPALPGARLFQDEHQGEEAVRQPAGNPSPLKWPSFDQALRQNRDLSINSVSPLFERGGRGDLRCCAYPNSPRSPFYKGGLRPVAYLWTSPKVMSRSVSTLAPERSGCCPGLGIKV